MTLRLRKTSRLRHRGFTLIETAVAMTIVSVAVVALCELLSAGTAANLRGTEMTTGVYLANAVHEMTLGVSVREGARPVIGPYRTIWDLNGKTFSPPIDGARNPISNYTGWEQQVVVRTVDNRNVDEPLREDRAGPTARLSVSVFHNGQCVYTGRWLMSDDDPS